jgi:hypothetical protein
MEEENEKRKQEEHKRRKKEEGQLEEGKRKMKGKMKIKLLSFKSCSIWKCLKEA